MSKLALKKLTASDLTLFEWQFRHRNAGNQKAINLNADVFIDALFPALPALGSDRLPIDLYLYGPAGKGELNLQRKIIKGGAYKNWRLNGEMIHNPDDDSVRFNALAEGDIAILEFNEGISPSQARCVFIAAALTEDAPLHVALAPLLQYRSMTQISERRLEALVREARIPSDHSVHALLLDADLEDASQGGVEAIRHLRRRRGTRRIQRADLLDARRRAEENGHRGEELINGFLQRKVDSGQYESFEWASSTNAVSPFDFLVRDGVAAPEHVEVKSTSGQFERPMHVSLSEIQEMAERERYTLYRIYNLTEIGADLRIALNLRAFGQSILDALRYLPAGVSADGVTVTPDVLSFGEIVHLSVTD
jgi:hypothetical protein